MAISLKVHMFTNLASGAVKRSHSFFPKLAIALSRSAAEAIGSSVEASHEVVV